MKLRECLDYANRLRRDELVITSAGTMSATWWDLTHDSEATFYLEASMSLVSMFGAGIAMGLPNRDVWAFNGDGAFCMNPGCLMVERQMNLPNLTHFLISNRCYGATHAAALPNAAHNDYATVARGFGIEHVFCFDSLDQLEPGFREAVGIRAPKLVVLEVDPPDHTLAVTPLEGPEIKYRFGRYIERTAGIRIFEHGV
ncbi:MAG TPA: thiamine pyrophosphate-dependent enzyme [Chloroflexota bacterium]|jgi:thiamine pyrophosphate-dependent acetolactate synthase large subunit-like protein